MTDKDKRIAELEEAGEVEPDWTLARVKAALRQEMSKPRPGGASEQFSQLIDDMAAAALAAMRPVSVDREKLNEIRERHEDWKRYRETDRGVRTQSAHVDLEWLLSVLEGVNHETD